MIIVSAVILIVAVCLLWCIAACRHSSSEDDEAQIQWLDEYAKRHSGGKFT